jgi:hypothetical protein
MYEVIIYRITVDLWRWEIRCGGALLRCGTSHTRATAQNEAAEVVGAA